MLVDAWITKDSPTSRSCEYHCGDAGRGEGESNLPHAPGKPMPSIIGKSGLGMLTVVRNMFLGPQYKGDIYVLGEDFGLPLNNIGMRMATYAQIQRRSIYVGNQFVAKSQDYFAEDVTGVVTYRIAFIRWSPLSSWQSDGGLQRQAAQTQPRSEDKLTIASL